MEYLPDADTVGNEDEMGPTCSTLMWMDGVHSDEELCLLEATAGSEEMRRAGVQRPMPPLPSTVTPVTRSGVDGDGPGFNGPETGAISLDSAAAHLLFLVLFL